MSHPFFYFCRLNMRIASFSLSTTPTPFTTTPRPPFSRLLSIPEPPHSISHPIPSSKTPFLALAATAASVRKPSPWIPTPPPSRSPSFPTAKPSPKKNFPSKNPAATLSRAFSPPHSQEQDSDDSSVKAPHDKKKKRRRFGISIFGKKKTSRGEVSSDSDSSSDPKPSRTAGESARPRGGLGVSLPSPTKNSKNSSVIPAGNATSVSNSMNSMSPMGPMSSKNSMNSMSSMSSIGPMGVSRGLGKPSKEFHTEDLENLRRKVMQQKQEIEQLVETGKLMQAELGRSRAEHRKNLKEPTRLASGNRSSLKAMWG